MRNASNKLLFALLVTIAGFLFSCNNTEDAVVDTPDEGVIPEITTDTGNGISQGYKYNKSWDISVEAGAAFTDLYTDSSGRTYALSNGFIYSCRNNLNWQREPVNAGYSTFYSINGCGDDVFATGFPSALYHKKGNGDWVKEKVFQDSLYLMTAYGCNNELWLAGFPKGIWHRDKAGRWEQELNTRHFITSFVANARELWALGEKAVYYKKPGSQWDSLPITCDNVSFHALYQYNHQLWVMGNGGNIYYNNGGKKWIKENSLDNKHNIFCCYGYGNDVYAAGSNGLVLHRQPNGKWLQETTGYQDFSASCMYGRGNNIWIGGNNGYIFHKSGNGNWRKEAGPVRGSDIHAINGRGDTIFAAARNATLLSNVNNLSWTRAGSIMPDTPFTSIFKFSNGLLVGGKNGILYHLPENGQWQMENSHAGNVVFSNLYENDKSIYLVGTDGTVTWRHKKDTVWSSTTVGTDRLTRIYGYGDDIWIMGTGSTLMHKKEADHIWAQINIGLTEVDFMDVYGWKDQIWALGIKDNRGVIFYKDSRNTWQIQEVHNGVDHYHALYGHGDTVYAAGASGDWGSKDKTDATYQGTIICKEGNKPWKVQINHRPGVHFNDINGIGDSIYAVGNNGHVFHKFGNGDWDEDETNQDNETLNKLIFHKGLVILSENGFVYHESDDRNFIRINRTGRLVNFAEYNGELYCASSDAIYKIKPTIEKYPVVDKVNYSVSPAINPNTVNLTFALQYPWLPSTNEKYGLEFYARAYSDEYAESKWVMVDASKTKVRVNPNTHTVLVSTSFEVVKSFRVIPGMESANKISLRVALKTKEGLSRESFVLRDSKGNPYITINNNFWGKYKNYIIYIGSLLSYFLFWIAYALLFPSSFLRFYHSNKMQQLMALKPQSLITVVNILLPLKILTTTARVQNAWVRSFASIGESKYDLSEVTRQRMGYVSLPVCAGDPVKGQLIKEPDLVMMNELFDKKRTIIQIIGPGGAGKTSLAVEMGRWMFWRTKNRRSGQKPMVPIILESGSRDLMSEITRILRSWKNDYTLQEDFVKTLLKSQRLVIIIDALSERPHDIQEYYKQLHGHLPVNALIITARQPVDLEVREGVCLYPQPLEDNLLYFITAFLKKHHNQSLSENRDKLAFAWKVVSIVEGNKSKAVVTPLLVKLIIEMALPEGIDKDIQTILAEMPNSIPDVYYQYLEHVNPASPSAVNYLPKEEMIQVAELLGRLSLGDNFFPKDFLEKEARKAIAHFFPHISNDPIALFISNGILTRRPLHLGNNYLRFNLDPLAEYLAASKLFDENNTTEGQLQAFIKKVNTLPDEVKEFKIAFTQICDYKMQMQLYS